MLVSRASPVPASRLDVLDRLVVSPPLLVHRDFLEWLLMPPSAMSQAVPTLKSFLLKRVAKAAPALHPRSTRILAGMLAVYCILLVVAYIVVSYP